MTCNYENPEMLAAAKQARRDMARDAKTDDELLAAGESTIEDFIPVCECAKCAKHWLDDQIEEQAAHYGMTVEQHAAYMADVCEAQEMADNGEMD